MAAGSSRCANCLFPPICERLLPFDFKLWLLTLSLGSCTKSRSAAEGFSRPRGLPRKIPQRSGGIFEAAGPSPPWPRGLPRAYCMDSKNSMPLLSAVRVTTAFFQLAV